jgi:Flp pilus assembly protein TadD
MDEALSDLDAADHAQHDRTAAILLGEIAGRRAGALLTQRRFPEAEAQARAALDASRLDVGAWFALAIARAARGDRVGARSAADSLLAVRPGDPDGLQLKAALEHTPAR